jgi:hypothetical protein
LNNQITPHGYQGLLNLLNTMTINHAVQKPKTAPANVKSKRGGNAFLYDTSAGEII